MALPALPASVLAGDVYVITQGTGRASVNTSLAQNLSAQPWAEAVSPEVFGLTAIGGTPVLVRAADPEAFLRLERGTWVEGGAIGTHWAAAGSGLRARLGLSPGESLTLTGSSIPRLAIVPLSGVFRTPTSADDELLVDYGTAHFLTGVPEGTYHSIRVRTSDRDALLAFLAAVGASVRVSGPSGAVGGANTEPATDPRLVNVLLRYGTGTLPLDYVSEALAEATASVRVVAWGIAGLLGLLVALGVHAVQARAFAERRASVGILRALGAGNRWMRLRLLREAAPLAAGAATFGGLLGFAFGILGPPSSVALAFGHAVRPSWDPIPFLLLVLLLTASSLVSQLLLLQGALKARPLESLADRAGGEPAPSLEVVLRS